METWDSPRVKRNLAFLAVALSAVHCCTVHWLYCRHHGLLRLVLNGLNTTSYCKHKMSREGKKTETNIQPFAEIMLHVLCEL
uniref:Uncharacterized protein n=1 Tax=Anguilla anguilla TaxID=7936 RepID=A0A0E9WWQ9_ANGAN